MADKLHLYKERFCEEWKEIYTVCVADETE